MPLLIDNNPIQLQGDLASFIRTYGHLQSQSRAFRLITPVNVDAEQTLYVHQLEYVVISATDSIDIVSVADFTTCCCLVVRHNGSGATAVGHFDENDIQDSINSLANSIVKLTQEWAQLHNITQTDLINKFYYEVHLVGGFLDARAISEEVLWQLLQSLNALPIDLHLRTACIWSNNTYYQDNIPLPAVTSLVFDVKNNNISPANITNHGPLYEIRSLRYTMRPPLKMQSIYDPYQRMLDISCFESTLTDDTIQRLLGLNTNSFLHFLSTSPLAEKADFVVKTKVALMFLRENRSLFNPNKSYKFIRVNNRWEKLVKM